MDKMTFVCADNVNNAKSQVTLTAKEHDRMMDISKLSAIEASAAEEVLDLISSDEQAIQSQDDEDNPQEESTIHVFESAEDTSFV